MVFDYLSFARAKKNTEELEKTNPQNPVLKKDDEEFLEKVTSQDVQEGAADDNTLGHEPGDAPTEDGDQIPKQKRTWASYVPNVSVPSVSVPSVSVPSMPSMPSMPAMPAMPSWTSSKGKQEEVDQYPAGVKVTENVKLDPAKQDADEKEVSVLLDRMNLSAINNRVFSLSAESQKLYESFTVVLKDMMNGAPTAYEDMEKLLKENDKQLRQLFGNLPPFVRTLVKSLPAKLGTTLGPEILAAASEKPGADLKAQQSAAARTPSPTGKRSNKKNVPSVKALSKQRGAVAGMLKSTVTFLQTRFPAFITGTNIIMSLAVFILLFVFWYCHKRGRETRLQKEAGEASSSVEEDGSDDIDSSLDESQVLTPPDSDAGLDAAAAEVKRRLDAADAQQTKTG